MPVATGFKLQGLAGPPVVGPRTRGPDVTGAEARITAAYCAEWKQKVIWTLEPAELNTWGDHTVLVSLAEQNS